MSNWLIAYLAFHVVCGVFTYAGILAFFEREQSAFRGKRFGPYHDFARSKRAAIIFARLGPFGLLVGFLGCFYFDNGLMFVWRNPHDRDA